ncbi:gamma-mobile-trio recombinase GmtY [Thaumasiovibrio sp. DFM-14]|uniref:gamma-mobile-trio recombinase GmtY n=1 Tax=Thaumasiovibrio sp. DFM-14 TaxID=3384792 RepID=UPI00399FF2FB
MHSSTALKARITLDNTGTQVETPVIVTSEGVLKSYLNYLLAFRHKSESWKNRSVFAVRLLLDYMNANKGVFEKPKDMFREFSNALFTGTVGNDGSDPSGLRWQPRKEPDANFLINLITHYTDYLSEVNEDEGYTLNPFRDASPFEQRLNWAAYYQKRDRAFLSHLWKRQDATLKNSKVRQVKARNKTLSVGIYDIAKAFPDGRINDLLYQGFVYPGKEHCKVIHERLNLRDVLITILMHYGGLRISEVCHIYVQDIVELQLGGKTQRAVKVYHPSLGLAPIDDRMTRREYLQKHFGLKPRNEYPASQKRFAGWKNSMLTNVKGKFFTVEFFPEKAKEQFFLLWKMYLMYQRFPPKKGQEHPYAFTSREGTPYTIKSYFESRKRAVERIGLEYSKEACTTPHADRHRYGQNLAESGVPSIVIKTAMHHSSIQSQQVYTQPTEKEVRRQLKNAEQTALTNSSINLQFLSELK